jgi:hypothetical protein
MGVSRGKKLDVLRRREWVADLYSQGRTQVAIAEHVAVQQPTFWDDLKKIRQHCRESASWGSGAASDPEL